MPLSAPKLSTIISLVLFGAASGAVGWWVGDASSEASDSRAVVQQAPMEAVVESVGVDGHVACLMPLDPTRADDLGGSVCGEVFVPQGTTVSESDRVGVRWFSVSSAGGGRADEVFVLTAAARAQ